jgi:hypothetical protein
MVCTALNVVLMLAIMGFPLDSFVSISDSGLIRIGATPLAASLYGAFTGLLLSCHYIWQNEHVVTFPRVPEERNSRILRTVVPTLQHALAVPLLSILIFSAAAYILGIFSTYFITFDGSVHQYHNHAHTLLSHQDGFYFSLYMALALVTVTFRFIRHTLEVFFTKPFTLDYPQCYTNRNIHLISALKMKDDPLLLHHAFLDLYRLARFSPERRKAVFADVKGQSWLDIMAAGRSQIDKLTSHLQEGVKDSALHQEQTRNGTGGLIIRFIKHVSQLVLPVRLRTFFV